MVRCADVQDGIVAGGLDFLAVLAYERASVARTRKPIRWRIRTARHEHGLEPEKIPTDIVAGHRVERLTIERIA